MRRIQIIPHPDPDPEVGMKRIKIRESLKKTEILNWIKVIRTNAVLDFMLRIQIIPHPDPDPEVGMKRIQIQESLKKRLKY